MEYAAGNFWVTLVLFSDQPLVAKIARTKKPLIISTGMANLREIEATVRVAKKNGSKKIILLYCVSNYPSDINDFTLANIEILKKKFKCNVGLSDHSKGNLIASLAISMGAEFFEKHIALDNQTDGVDIEFSAKGKELKDYVKTIRDSSRLLKKRSSYGNSSDKKMKLFRRSIFAIKDIKKGDLFSKENIKRIRPGNGIPPSYYNLILGKKSPKSINYGEPIKNEIIKKLNIK